MQRLLVIVVTRIGDTLLATPAIRALAVEFPEAEITVLAHPKRKPLLLHLPFIQHLGSITKRQAVLRGCLGAFFGKPYDAALVFGHDTALLNYALRVSRKVVAQTQKDPRFPRQLAGLTLVDDAPIKEHTVNLGLRLAQVLGAKPAGRFLSCVVGAEEQRAARQRMQALYSALGDPAPTPSVVRWVGVQLQSFPTKAYRDWPLQNFVQLLQRLFVATPDICVVVLGDAASVKAAENLRRHFPQRVVSVAGQTDLRETAAVISLLALYIGVDTGPTHLAGALGVPMVALYHCRHRGRDLAPLEHRSLSVIEHPAGDEQCSSQSSMADISVEVVWSAVQQRLHIGNPESR